MMTLFWTIFSNQTCWGSLQSVPSSMFVDNTFDWLKRMKTLINVLEMFPGKAQWLKTSQDSLDFDSVSAKRF